MKTRMRCAWNRTKFQRIVWPITGILLICQTFLLTFPTTSNASQLSPIQKLSLPKRGISAHRGGILGCPGNTIGAFQRAICHGVHQIEFDVRATADNVLIVAHDDQVTDIDGHSIHISETRLTEIQALKLEPCQNTSQNERIPTFEETLAMMPENIWINVDIKENTPHMAKLVTEMVSKLQRFDQVIFAARDKTAPAIRQIVRAAKKESWIANMSREMFRWQYIDATLTSQADFIQLVHVPYLPFIRGKPNQKIMRRLHEAGVRVNYSWLRNEDENELKHELHDLFNRGIDFVLVDHVKQAMNAANALGIPPLIPHWKHSSLPSHARLPHCAQTP